MKNPNIDLKRSPWLIKFDNYCIDYGFKASYSPLGN